MLDSEDDRPPVAEATQTADVHAAGPVACKAEVVQPPSSATNTKRPVASPMCSGILKKLKREPTRQDPHFYVLMSVLFRKVSNPTFACPLAPAIGEAALSSKGEDLKNVQGEGPPQGTRGAQMGARSLGFREP